MDALLKALQEMLESAIEEDFETPIRVASIAANGTATIGEYREGADGLEFRKLAEHSLHDWAAYPIHMMLVDGTGIRSLHVSIDSDGRQRRLN
jgi:hypothetical protein